MTVTIIDYKTAKGWLLPEERELLFDKAFELPPNATILNIGVEFGGSLACLRAGNPTARIIGVDLDVTKVLAGGYDCELVQDSSAVYFRTFKGPLDLIFVDGDHGFAGVLADARFADYLPVGRYILFQDCYDHDERGVVHKLVPGVNAAVDEWFAFHTKEFEELPYVGSTRIFKRVG